MLWAKQRQRGLRRESSIAKYFRITLRPQQLSDIGLSYLQCLSRLLYRETWGVLKVVLGHRGFMKEIK